MNPEIEALIATYQRRLSDVTAQAIAFEARIVVLQKQLQELANATPAPVPSAPPKKQTKSKKVASQDGGSF